MNDKDKDKSPYFFPVIGSDVVPHWPINCGSRDFNGGIMVHAKRRIH